MVLKWLTSRTVRTATAMGHEVRRLMNEQRDLLSPGAVEKLEEALGRFRAGLRGGLGKAALEQEMAELEKVALQWLKPYPNATARENVKEILVAVTVIFAVTTFFLQLTKIPTGSMQPTLFGITHRDLRHQPGAEIPGFFRRCYELAVKGTRYYHVSAKADGAFVQFMPPRTVLPFVKYQTLAVGDKTYRIWFPPDRLEDRSGLGRGSYFREGEDIIKLRVVSGDHLLVDRFTYNFRRPKRGEIIVFKTRGIEKLPQDQLYIKRLVALGGERVKLGDDQHLRIDGHRLDAATPHFENVYTFEPRYKENGYFGHVNQSVVNRFEHPPYLAPLFPNEHTEYVVPEDEYLAMGDNTLNSRDSREWGGLPSENVIGKCWFVYWPITERFGWGVR